MKIVDERTAEEHSTHPCIVLMTDRFMSGWGGAGKGPSYAGWACRDCHENAVESWVRNRGDAMRVRFVGADYRPPNIEGHCHIYVVRDDHPAIRCCPGVGKGHAS